jgi:hypothetical protein
VIDGQCARVDESRRQSLRLLQFSAPWAVKLLALSRRRAIAALSGMVGALVLARAVDDRTLSDEILRAAREAFGDASHR